MVDKYRSKVRDLIIAMVMFIVISVMTAIGYIIAFNSTDIGIIAGIIYASLLMLCSVALFFISTTIAILYSSIKDTIEEDRKYWEELNGEATSNKKDTK